MTEKQKPECEGCKAMHWKECPNEKQKPEDVSTHSPAIEWAECDECSHEVFNTKQANEEMVLLCKKCLQKRLERENALLQGKIKNNHLYIAEIRKEFNGSLQANTERANEIEKLKSKLADAEKTIEALGNNPNLRKEQEARRVGELEGLKKLIAEMDAGINSGYGSAWRTQAQKRLAELSVKEKEGKP